MQHSPDPNQIHHSAAESATTNFIMSAPWWNIPRGLFIPPERVKGVDADLVIVVLVIALVASIIAGLGDVPRRLFTGHRRRKVLRPPVSPITYDRFAAGRDPETLVEMQEQGILYELYIREDPFVTELAKAIHIEALNRAFFNALAEGREK